MKKIIILMLSALFISNAAIAQNTDEEISQFTFKPMLVIGIATGGDDMGEVNFDDGSSETVTAGGGFTFGGGFEISAANKPYGATATVNYHSDSAEASNGSFTMDRFEFTFIPYYQANENFQLGAGISLHTSVELSQDLSGSDSLEFDSASALVLQGRYVFEGGNMALAGRYTSVEYEASEFNGSSVSGGDAVDGSNIGLFFTMSFGH